MAIKHAWRFRFCVGLLTTFKFVVGCILHPLSFTMRITTHALNLFWLYGKYGTIALVSLTCTQPLTTYATSDRSLERIADLGEELLDEQAKQRQTYEEEAGIQSLVCAEEPPKLSEEDTQAFIAVVEIDILGTDLLTREEQACLVTPYVGKRTSLAELKALATDITRCLMDKGYLTTRAYLPQQTLSGMSLPAQI